MIKLKQPYLITQLIYLKILKVFDEKFYNKIMFLLLNKLKNILIDLGLLNKDKFIKEI